jgi:YidC/Oxa1 family membrane protein insertase
MDKKSISILVLCFALLLVWPSLVRKIYPPKPLPPGATNVVAAATSTNFAPAAVAFSKSALGSSTNSAVASLFDTNAPEQLLVVSNADAHYTFTSRGGGLKSVDLLHYPEKVSAIRKKRTTGGDVVTLNELSSLPVGALLDDGTAMGDGIYQLSQTPKGVRAEKILESGVAVVKEFSLSTNYLVTMSVRIENRTAASVSLPSREIAVGMATPDGARDKGQFVAVNWYDGKTEATVNAMWFANRRFGCMPGTPRAEYLEGSNNVVWVSSQNQFFTLAAMAENPALAVAARPVKLPYFADPETGVVIVNGPQPQGIETSLLYPAVKLAPGAAVEEKIHLFAGPKKYDWLAKISEQYNNNVELVMGYGGFFGGFSRALLLAMNWLHNISRLPYGWVIILLTVLIKLVFWPLTQVSTRSMKRMQAFQPQMNAIKEKYKDDPAKMNRKTMEFMKENKINPMGGCLPMLIQLPILMGFYRMIQSAIELRGAPFLWIGDLSRPDTLFTIQGMGFVPIIGIPGVGLPINLLPLIMGATQLWQARLTPPSPGMDAGQQKMMRYMPLMFMVIFYNFSAGLALYWTVQNLLTVLQTKMIRTDIAAVSVAPLKKK